MSDDETPPMLQPERRPVTPRARARRQPPPHRWYTLTEAVELMRARGR